MYAQVTNRSQGGARNSVQAALELALPDLPTGGPDVRYARLKRNVRMTATVHALDRRAATRSAPLARVARAPIPSAADAGDEGWLVDVVALARCRELLAGREPMPVASQSGAQALLDVPPAYAQFCRNHFAAVQRLHPELAWADARQAYAVALSAHALLYDGLDEQHEALLAVHWPAVRGDSRMEWPQARSLVADGCSALARLDPLSMHR
jgi:hypothetical protein